MKYILFRFLISIFCLTSFIGLNPAVRVYEKAEVLKPKEKVNFFGYEPFYESQVSPNVLIINLSSIIFGPQREYNYLFLFEDLNNKKYIGLLRKNNIIHEISHDEAKKIFYSYDGKEVYKLSNEKIQVQLAQLKAREDVKTKDLLNLLDLIEREQLKNNKIIKLLLKDQRITKASKLYNDMYKVQLPGMPFEIEETKEVSRQLPVFRGTEYFEQKSPSGKMETIKEEEFKSQIVEVHPEQESFAETVAAPKKEGCCIIL